MPHPTYLLPSEGAKTEPLFQMLLQLVRYLIHLFTSVLPPNDDPQPWYSPHLPSTEAAKYDCQVFANNNNVTCFPPAGEKVYQHQWAAVVCTLLASYALIHISYTIPYRE